MCPCRGGRAWEGGEGRVQAERPTRTRSQGQGNGPEGERHTELDRSPCPGRRCPCGCPQQVDRLSHPLARGVARMAPHHYGWPRSALSTARRDSPGSSQTWLVTSRRPTAPSIPRPALTSSQEMVPSSAISAQPASAASSPRSDSGLRFSPILAAVASDLRDHSRNNDDPHEVAPAPADTTPVSHPPHRPSPPRSSYDAPPP